MVPSARRVIVQPRATWTAGSREAIRAATTSSRPDARPTAARERSRATVGRASGRLDVVAARIAALDPAVQVARGWSITRRGDGTIVRSVDDLAVGDELTTIVIDGSIHSTVRTVSPTTSHATED